MERAVIKSILANAELSDDAKLEQIMNLNGADITREKDTAKQIKADLEAANSKLEGFSDYERTHRSVFLLPFCCILTRKRFYGKI